MNDQDTRNQVRLEKLVEVSAALKAARATLSGSGYYIDSVNRSIYNRLTKANEAIADAIAIVSKRMS